MEDGPEGPPSKMEPRPNGPGQCLEGVSDSSFRVAKKKPGEGVHNACNVKCTEHYQHTPNAGFTTFVIQNAFLSIKQQPRA